MPLRQDSDSPKYSETMSGPLITKNVALASLAAALARAVLPVPVQQKHKRLTSYNNHRRQGNK